MQVVDAAVPSLLVGEGVGDALGVGLTTVAFTLPAVQSVATKRTIGETRELSRVNFVIPVWAANTFAASACDDL